MFTSAKPRIGFWTVLAVMLATLTACTNLPVLNSGNEWDFDHELQYKQTKLTSTTYQIEVVANKNTRFEHLSAFLLRQSYRICGQYGYKLEMIKGIESFDHNKASPNLIVSNLTANLECPIAQ